MLRRKFILTTCLLGMLSLTGCDTDVLLNGVTNQLKEQLDNTTITRTDGEVLIESTLSTDIITLDELSTLLANGTLYGNETSAFALGYDIDNIAYTGINYDVRYISKPAHNINSIVYDEATNDYIFKGVNNAYNLSELIENGSGTITNYTTPNSKCIDKLNVDYFEELKIKSQEYGSRLTAKIKAEHLQTILPVIGNAEDCSATLTIDFSFGKQPIKTILTIKKGDKNIVVVEENKINIEHINYALFKTLIELK